MKKEDLKLVQPGDRLFLRPDLSRNGLYDGEQIDAKFLNKLQDSDISAQYFRTSSIVNL